MASFLGGADLRRARTMMLGWPPRPKPARWRGRRHRAGRDPQQGLQHHRPQAHDHRRHCLRHRHHGRNLVSEGLLFKLAFAVTYFAVVWICLEAVRIPELRGLIKQGYETTMRITTMVVFILIGSTASRWCSSASPAASGWSTC